MSDYQSLEIKHSATSTDTSGSSRSYQSLSEGETASSYTKRGFPCNLTRTQVWIGVAVGVVVILTAVLLAVYLKPSSSSSAEEADAYQGCNISVIGSGWGGLYYAYRIAVSSDAIFTPNEVCIFEVSGTRVGGRAYSFHPNWEDVKVDLGSYRHDVGQELLGGVLHSILNRTTICWLEDGLPCDSEVLADPYGNNAGYQTAVLDFLEILYQKGVRPVFMNHELVNVEPMNTVSSTLHLTFANGKSINSQKVFLNIPKTSLFRLQPSNLILSRATNQTLSALQSPRECITGKQYVRYDDAWWLTKLNYSYGTNTTADDEQGVYPPIRDMDYFDGPIKCRILVDGQVQYAPDRIKGGDCWGALLSFYEGTCNFDNVQWYENLSLSSERSQDVSIQISQGDERDGILTETHQRLMAFHNQTFQDLGINPSSIASPTSTVISIWDSVNYRWNYPGSSELLDGTGNVTQDDDFQIRNQVLIPVPGYDLFIANEAWSGLDGMAEGSLLLVERLLVHRFKFNKPAYVSSLYWSSIVTPSMPPPQECFLNSDCPPSTQCIISACINGSCHTDILFNQTCDDGNTCTLNDRCTIDGLCVGNPLICTGIEICVDGQCLPPNPPALPTCSFQHSFGSFHLYWNWIGSDAIRIAFSLPGSGYIGLGLGNSMVNTDIFLGWVYGDGTFNVQDYWSQSTVPPRLDTSIGGINSINETWATRVNGVTTVWFTRLLNTSDPFDTIITKSDVTHFVFAWNNGNPGSLIYHQNNKMAVLVDMTGC